MSGVLHKNRGVISPWGLNKSLVMAYAANLSEPLYVYVYSESFRMIAIAVIT